MGQRINAQGWRTGFHRGWVQSWVSNSVTEWKDVFLYQFEIELFFQFFLSNISYRRIIKILKILLVFIKTFKIQLSESTLFIFFYKMRTPRRRVKRNFKKFYRKKVYLKKYNQKRLKKPFSKKQFFQKSLKKGNVVNPTLKKRYNNA